MKTSVMGRCDMTFRWSAYASLCRGDDRLFLDVVDYMLASYTQINPRRLESLLVSAGSAWRVSGAGKGLERRLDPTATTQLSAAVDAGGRPGEHLAIAWTAIFGRNPDPTKAYAEAVKALEAAVCPLVIPNEKTPTLGKAIGHLRAQPSQFQVTLGMPNPEFGVSAVVQMLDLIWRATTTAMGAPTPQHQLPSHSGRPRPRCTSRSPSCCGSQRRCHEKLNRTKPKEVG